MTTDSFFSDESLPNFKPLSEIRLTRKERQLLIKCKHGYKKKTKSRDMLSLKFNGLVDGKLNDNSDFIITGRGEKWLDFYYQDILAKWIPLVISYILSIVAIIISVIALLLK